MDKRRRRQETLIQRMRRELVARRRTLRGRGVSPHEIRQILQPMRQLLRELQEDLLTHPTTSLH